MELELISAVGDINTDKFVVKDLTRDKLLDVFDCFSSEKHIYEEACDGIVHVTAASHCKDVVSLISNN